MMTDTLASEIEPLLRVALDAPKARVVSLDRLSGGSSREIWALDLSTEEDRVRHLILRRDAPGEVRAGAAATEAAVMRAAYEAGVRVPQVLAVLEEGVAQPGLVMDRIDGETLPRRVLGDPALATARAGLARECGTALGRLHRISPAPSVPEYDRLAVYRATLDTLGYRRPVLELAYRWLVDNRPEPRAPVLVHGDFRLGNLVVGSDGLRAVLDWESAHLGDPLEDLGWLCVPAWRFRGDGEVGGFGPIDDLLEAYAEHAPQAVTAPQLAWGIVLGTWVWAVGCLEQAQRHLSGAQRSIDLAAVGRRVVENEADLLDLLDAHAGHHLHRSGSTSAGHLEPNATDRADDDAPFGPPSLRGLLDAVRECLHEELLPDTKGRQRYLLLVCINVLAMLDREVARSASILDGDVNRWAAFGAGSDSAVAQLLRDTTLDDTAELRAALRAWTADLLDVVAPDRSDPFRQSTDGRQ